MPNFTSPPGVLLTGCAGFIGSHLTEYLLERGFAVTGIDDLSTGKEEYLESAKSNRNFFFIKHDINTGVPSEITKKKFDYILHLASVEIYSASPDDDSEYRSLLTNSLGVKILLDLALKNKAKFLLTSSLNIYQGMLSSANMENYFGADSLSERHYSYTESKRFAEALVWQYYKQHDLDVRIVRLPEVYGPRMGFNTSSSLGGLLNSFLHNQDLIVSGDGLIKERYAYVSDVADLIYRSMVNEKSKGYIFPLVPNLVTPLEIAYLLKDFSGGELDILFRPSKKADAIPTVEKVDSSSLSVLNFNPKVSFKDGTRKTVEWFREETVARSSGLPKAEVRAKPSKHPEPIPKIKTAPTRSFSFERIKQSISLPRLPQAVGVGKVLGLSDAYAVKVLIAVSVLLMIIGGGITVSQYVAGRSSDTAELTEIYYRGDYDTVVSESERLLNDISSRRLGHGVLVWAGSAYNEEELLSKYYLYSYLRYVSRAKLELRDVLVSSLVEPDPDKVFRPNSVLSQLEAAGRYLDLYSVEAVRASSLIDIGYERQKLRYLIAVSNNLEVMFTGRRNFLIVVTDPKQSTYYLGQPVENVVVSVDNYGLEGFASIDVQVDDRGIDFAEYADRYINEAQKSLSAPIHGIVFIDKSVLLGSSINEFLARAARDAESDVLKSLSKAVEERRLLFYPALSGISLSRDLDIYPELAFDANSDFVYIVHNNRGGTASSPYIINNIVYSVVEEEQKNLIEIAFTMIHTGRENTPEEGVFSGDLTFLRPYGAENLRIMSEGRTLTRGLDFMVTEYKYGTSYVKIPLALGIEESKTFVFRYEAERKESEGYTLVVPIQAGVRAQNFTFRFEPLNAGKYNLEGFQKEGSIYKYSIEQEEHLEIKL